MFDNFPYLTLFDICIPGKDQQLDRNLIDYLEIGPTFLDSSGAFPALLHTCWFLYLSFVLFLKQLFCAYLLAIKDCDPGWAISLGSSHTLVIVPGLNIFESAVVVVPFQIISEVVGQMLRFKRWICFFMQLVGLTL